MGDMFQWVAVILIALGLVISITRNNKRSQHYSKEEAEEKGQLIEKVDTIEKAINHPEFGLGAINKNVNKMAANCFAVTEGFKDRIKDLERKD